MARNHDPRLLVACFLLILSSVFAGSAFAQAPAATTAAATGIGSTGAILNGTVNANGATTVVTFEYGLDTGYGGTVVASQSPVSGSTNTSVTAVDRTSSSQT